MLEDKLLVLKCRHGNKDAMCRIYEKYKDYLLKPAGGFQSNRPDAEDKTRKSEKPCIKTSLSVCNRVMEDKLLIWKFRRGSRDALRRIYDKHHGHLLKLAVVLTGNVDAAEDVVQEVFVNFARSADRFGPTGSLKSYLITSTLNCVRNQRRDNKRRKLQSLDKAEHVPSMARRPDQWAVLSEHLERLSKAMTCLPYEQREVITLRTEAKMTLRQIARLQETSVSTVNARYRYGVEKLRSLLNGEVTE